MTLDRETLAAQLYTRGNHNPESAFADADAFIEECEKQRKQSEPPKECEHFNQRKLDDGKRYCLDCGAPMTCDHAWTSVDGKPFYCMKCDAIKPAPKREGHKTHCGDIYCPQCNALFAKTEPAPKQETPKCEHEWVQYCGSIYRCQKCCMYKPDPAPKREPREWNLYKIRDNIFAYPSTDLTIPYSGDKHPVFICKVREVLE